MNEEIPQIIKDVGFDFHWDVRKVWKLDYPVEEVAMEELAWHFAIPFWNTKNGFYDLTPQEVINDPTLFQEEYARTMRAGLNHPIDIMQNKGRWLILDGLHRLVKANILGYAYVKVRKIPRSEIPRIKKK